jgi:hypothetical protein
MKVVINADFGGFNLSNEAIEECIKRGMKVTHYHYENKKSWYDDENADFYYAPEKDNLSGAKYYPIGDDDSNIFRSNPIVVRVVEDLGEKANGFCAELKIVDIPFDSVEGWEITEYDGLETIEAIHESWR